jgi:uncharacterized heparinase superfamily protein
MECGLRILSACFASDLVRPLAQGDQEFWDAVAKIVVTHARIVARQMSLYSSLGNHTVAESAGLFFAAVLFPEIPESSEWEKTAARTLRRAAEKEVLTDGGPAEQAFHYHGQVLDLLYVCFEVAEHCGRDLADIRSLHKSASAYIRHFASSRAELPEVGDNDQGYAISRYLLPSWVVSLERPCETSEKLSVFQSDASGYSRLYSSHDNAAIIFDHGPLGLAPNYAHGHADALSVQLTIAGEPVIVDVGTFSYGADTKWRSYFRGTSSHNTVIVDGRDQATQRGPFLWSNPYNCSLLYTSGTCGEEATIVACHDGYRDSGVTHIRAVEFIWPGQLIILDWLDGYNQHDLALRWHFSGELRSTGTSFESLCLPGLRCYVKGGTPRLLCGSTSPLGGWRSRDYGHKEPCCTLDVSAYVNLPHEFATIVYLPTCSTECDLSHRIGLLRNSVSKARARLLVSRGYAHART